MCVRQERQRLEERRNIFLLTKELKNICLWQVGVSGITVSYAIDNAYIYIYILTESSNLLLTKIQSSSMKIFLPESF